MNLRKRQSDAYRKTQQAGSGNGPEDGLADGPAASPGKPGSRKGGADSPARQAAQRQPAQPGEGGQKPAPEEARSGSDGETVRRGRTGRGSERAAVEQARRISGLVKVTADGEASPQGVKKVARFLMAVGRDEAAAVLRHLKHEEIEAVLREIMTISRLGRAEADEIVAEFGRVVRERALSPQGGPDVAQQMLEKAFGTDVAASILQRVAPQPKGRAFQFLEDLEPQQLVALAREESPAVIGLILAYLSPERGAAVIARLDEQVRQQVLLRIARMERVENDVLLRVEEALRDKIRTHGRIVTEELDGKAALARILRTMSPTDGSYVLDALRDEEPEVFREIKDELFTIDTLLLIADSDLQRVLRDFSDRDVAVILKGKSEDIRAKVLRNVSERRRSIIAEEYAHLGPMLRRDVEKTEREFIGFLRRMEETGEIVVRSEHERYV